MIVSLNYVIWCCDDFAEDQVGKGTTMLLKWFGYIHTVSYMGSFLVFQPCIFGAKNFALKLHIL